MNNRKGFTLIELLVAITIIGIIMLMTLPAIHNLQRENQKKKFDDYERTVLEAAKAYEDQYEEDLYGRNRDGCAAIKFSSLVNTKLLATTKISGYECNNNQNGVIIRRVNGTSFYEVYLTCNKGGEPKALTSNTDFLRDSSETYCITGDDNEAPEFRIECDKNPAGLSVGVQADEGHRIIEDGNEILYYTAPTDNNNNVGILPNLNTMAEDYKSGLEKNQFVIYEWKISNRSDTAEVYKEKNKSTYNSKDGTTARTTKAIRIIEPIKKIDTTGRAEIYITGENIVDRAGNKVDFNNPEAIKTCKYFYDNARPIMKVTVTGERTGRNYSQETNDWINEPVTIRIEVTDKTSDNDIYVGIKEDSFTNNGEQRTLNGTAPSYTYELHGETNKIINDEYKVCDKLGNCESQRISLRIDSEPPTCEITGDGNWNPAGANVTMRCKDPVISDVKTCGGSNGTSHSAHIKDDVTWTVVDNAGNTNTCRYHVERKKQYYQVNCQTGKECPEAGCAKTGKKCDSCNGYIYKGNYDSGGECQPKGTASCGGGTWCYTCHYTCCETVCVQYKADIMKCGCAKWKSTGTWKDSSCNSNNCMVDDERYVYK